MNSRRCISNKEPMLLKIVQGVKNLWLDNFRVLKEKLLGHSGKNKSW